MKRIYVLGFMFLVGLARSPKNFPRLRWRVDIRI